MLPLLFHSPPRPFTLTPTATSSFLSHHSRPLTTIAMHTTTTTTHHHHQDNSDQHNQAKLYHHQTKHSLTRYALGPRGLDWSNQPNPFLRYLSSPSLPLLHPSPPPPPSSPHYPLLFSPNPSPPQPSPTHHSLSLLLYHSLSLSAWKSTPHSTWSLRVNPSSGNLHPTETYLISPPLAFDDDPRSPFSSSPFVAHYAPKEHALELRSSIPASFFSRFSPKGDAFVVGFSSVFWREAWKYGERAFRYCNHDVGHAIGAVAVAAAALGWDARILDGLGHEELRGLLGIGRGFAAPEQEVPERPVKGRLPWVELEHPDCAVLVFPKGSSPAAIDYGEMAEEIGKFESLEWFGKPNSLSKEHVCWDIIYRTAKAVEKPLMVDKRFSVNPFRESELVSEDLYTNLSVWDVVRKRRSAVDMDGIHVMKKETFYQILLHCLPSGKLSAGEKQGKQLAVPFRVLPWNSEVHCAIFVHRVRGLQKGLYFLVRNEDHFDDLKRSMKAEFEWEKPEGCPAGLPLYRLAGGDCRELSKKLSCHQDIASDGCFSLGMVARFEPALHEKNAWMYPRLFWETGVLGQVLYLEAHAVGVSATGIGCYFDDAVHDVLGLKGIEFQSLYHFTVGSPVVDRRIMSLPAYPGPQQDA